MAYWGALETCLLGKWHRESYHDIRVTGLGIFFFPLSAMWLNLKGFFIHPVIMVGDIYTDVFPNIFIQYLDAKK